MPFDPFAPVSDTNPLPVVQVEATGDFELFLPISDTNPLPVTNP
jgi:hypothetical protein